MKTILFSLLLFCALPLAAQTQTEKYYTSKEVDQKIVITKRSQPGRVTPRCVDSDGKTVIRAFFHKSGVIDRTEIVSPSTCPQFDEAAETAARKTKFKPAIKNGQPVSYTTIIEYKWSRF